MAVMKALGWLAAAAGVLTSPAAAAVPDLNVVVTIKPIHSLVTRLLEGAGTPTLLVEGAASPHTFALKPSGARAINAADVLVRVSPDLETFTRAIVKALPATVKVVTLTDVPGIKLLDRREGGAFEPHQSEPAGKADHGNKDGHIWLDPDNAKAIVGYLASAFSARAPEHAARIAANAARLGRELDSLTAAIEAETRPLQDKPFVVFHDAYQYFERRFGLDAVGSITVSPDAQPSARRLIELRRKIHDLKAVCVFSEPLFQPRLVAAVTEGSAVREGTLDPEGRTLPPGGDLYFALMRGLASGLKTCLGQAS